MAREQRARMYPEIGLNESHHAMSHHGDNPENLAKYAKLCTWHVELFGYLSRRCGTRRTATATCSITR